jgi:hypothetical protein
VHIVLCSEEDFSSTTTETGIYQTQSNDRWTLTASEHIHFHLCPFHEAWNSCLLALIDRLRYRKCMSASRSLWRYFLGNKKTFILCEEGNGIEFDPLSGDWKRLPSYLKQYIITETGVIKSEETTVSYPHTNITEPNYTFRWLIEYPIYLKATSLKIVALQGFSLYKSCKPSVIRYHSDVLRQHYSCDAGSLK